MGRRRCGLLRRRRWRGGWRSRFAPRGRGGALPGRILLRRRRRWRGCLRGCTMRCQYYQRGSLGRGWGGDLVWVQSREVQGRGVGRPSLGKSSRERTTQTPGIPYPPSAAFASITLALFSFKSIFCFFAGRASAMPSSGLRVRVGYSDSTASRKDRAHVAVWERVQLTCRCSARRWCDRIGSGQ